jgi:hypothetical protein
MWWHSFQQILSLKKQRPTKVGQLMPRVQGRTKHSPSPISVLYLATHSSALSGKGHRIDMRLFAVIILLGYVLPALAHRNHRNTCPWYKGGIVRGTNNCFAECSVDRPGGLYRKLRTSCFEDCVGGSKWTRCRPALLSQSTPVERQLLDHECSTTGRSLTFLYRPSHAAKMHAV